MMSLKIKIFICFLLAMILPCIILGGYSYLSYNRSITNEVNRYVDLSLNQVSIKMDSALTGIKKYYIETMSSQDTSWFMDDEISYSNYTELKALQEKLKGPDYLIDYLGEYDLVNKSQDWVLSEKGLYPYSDVVNREAFEAIEPQTSSWAVERLDEDESDLIREKIRLNGLYYYIQMPVNSFRPSGFLVVNINLDALNTLVRPDDEGCEMMIYSKDGDLVFTTNNNLALAVQSQLNLKESSGNKEIRMENGVKYRVGIQASSVSDLYYVVGWNLESIQKEGTNILLVSLGIILGATLILIMVWGFTRVTYRPWERLQDYTHIVMDSSGLQREKDRGDKEVNFQKRGDAAKYISGQIDYLVDNTKTLTENFKRQQQQLSEFFLSRLINGNMHPDQIENYVERLEIPNKTYYVVLTASLQNKVDDDFDEVRQDALRLDVVENIPEDIKSHFMMQPSCNAKVITIVLSGDDETELERQAIEVYKGLDIYVQMSYAFPIKMGVSMYWKDLKDFKRAHNQALEALKSNDIMHKENTSTHFTGVMFYSDISKQTQVHYYEVFMEKEIRDAVDQGDKALTDMRIDTFVERQMYEHIGQTERQFHLQKLLNELLQIPLEAGIDIDTIFEGNGQNLYQDISRIYDDDKLKHFFKSKVSDPIMKALKNARTNRSEEIVREIVKLVEEKKGDMTLYECADILGYHSTYIWKVMKEELNMSYSDYLADYKLLQAKELLLESDMTVKEIAEKLNYTNAQNFIRFFSKMEGTTPGKYRKMKQ